MRILLSASDFTNATNGLARSARDFCAGLRARGHEVRVISYGDSSHVDYPLQRLSVPFLDRYISAENFNIARPDRSIFGSVSACESGNANARVLHKSVQRAGRGYAHWYRCSPQCPLLVTRLMHALA